MEEERKLGSPEENPAASEVQPEADTAQAEVPAAGDAPEAMPAASEAQPETAAEQAEAPAAGGAPEVNPTASEAQTEAPAAGGMPQTPRLQTVLPHPAARRPRRPDRIRSRRAGRTRGSSPVSGRAPSATACCRRAPSARDGA